MEVNIDRIKSRFNNKIRKEEIIQIYNQFKFINDIVKFKVGLEETIVNHFKYKLNIQTIQSEIIDRQNEMRKYENDIRLLSRSEFDELRQKGNLNEVLNQINDDDLQTLQYYGCVLSEEVSDIRLKRFRKKRDETNRNYNQLNVDGNISMGSNSEIWR